jgi:restriction endonuclease Mrr
MSSALRVVTIFLEESDLPDEIKQSLRNALLLEFRDASPTDFEKIVDELLAGESS